MKKNFNYSVKEEITNQLLSSVEGKRLLFYFYFRKYFVKNKNEKYLLIPNSKKFAVKNLIEFLQVNDFNFDIYPNNYKNYDEIKRIIFSEYEEVISWVKRFRINNLYQNIIFAAIFVVSGYVNSPHSKFYHMEMKLKNTMDQEVVNNILRETDISFKTKILKDGMIFMYIKKSSHISDIMKYMHAYDSVLFFEDVRIERDFISLYKKINSIDIYNIKKISDASFNQVKSIKIIYNNGKFDELKDKYQNIAEIRLKNPEISLQDLTNEYNIIYKTNLSKSTIYRWLKYIVDFERGN